jgi:hypothetical protein
LALLEEDEVGKDAKGARARGLLTARHSGMSRAALRLVYPKSQDCTARNEFVVGLGVEILDVVRVYD